MTSEPAATPSADPTSPLRLAVIGGDGIGPEVTAEAVKVLEAVSPVKIEQTRYDLGAERYLATGEVLPDSVLDEIRGHDAILLGAVGGRPGDPRLPAGILERGLLLRLRFELDHYVNLRPSRTYPGVPTPLADPGEVDFVVVREGTEGPYTGNGGRLRGGTPAEVATEVSLNTAYGVERVVRDAFARASRRPRRQLTLVHKTNVLVHAGGLWSRVVDEVGREFPDVTVDYLHVDAATIFLTTDPARFDVIVTDNLFGDILTDLAGAVTGADVRVVLISMGRTLVHLPKGHRGHFTAVEDGSPSLVRVATADQRRIPGWPGIPTSDDQGQAAQATRAAMASPISAVRRVAPGTRVVRSAVTAASTAAAASVWPRWSSSSPAERIAAVGSAIP
jgi:3-isopropylmalate dehydrogenase